MKNIDQLKCIKNTISTITRYTNYLIEANIVYDNKDQNLIKDIYLKTWYNQKVTWCKHLKNNWKTNKTILDYVNNLYESMYSLWLVSFSK